MKQACVLFMFWSFGKKHEHLGEHVLHMLLLFISLAPGAFCLGWHVELSLRPCWALVFWGMRVCGRSMWSLPPCFFVDACLSSDFIVCFLGARSSLLSCVRACSVIHGGNSLAPEPCTTNYLLHLWFCSHQVFFWRWRSSQGVLASTAAAAATASWRPVAMVFFALTACSRCHTLPRRGMLRGWCATAGAKRVLTS